MPPTNINFGLLLAPVLNEVTRAHRPRFLALLERTAAERYRKWADDLPAHADELRACGASEDRIADLIEAAFPMSEQDLAPLQQLVPEARRIYYSAFESLPLLDQLHLQADAERQGANAWRSVAAGETDPSVLQALARCSALEETSAEQLNRIVDAIRAPST